MSFLKRIRILVGILIVVLIVGGLFVYLNYSMSRVGSISAKLQADSYTVGTSYAGTIVNQYVQQGQSVTQGQQLFSIKSDALASDLAGGQVKKENLSFNVDSQNNIVLTAATSGVVTNINYLQGAFVPGNKDIATVSRLSSLYVTATYRLSPPDYARVNNGSIVNVTLPNNQVLQAKVFYISIGSSDNDVVTTVKARLQNTSSLNSFTNGTPVTAELHLNGTTLFESLKADYRKLIHGRSA